jgi:hypothetical protein
VEAVSEDTIITGKEDPDSAEISKKESSPGKEPSKSLAKPKKEPRSAVKAKKDTKLVPEKPKKKTKSSAAQKSTPKLEGKEKSTKAMVNSPNSEGKKDPDEKSPDKISPEKTSPEKKSTKTPALLASTSETDLNDYSEVVKRSRYDPIENAIWKRGTKTPYLAFAKTLQAIEATSGRLKTIEILANYFREVVYHKV